MDKSCQAYGNFHIENHNMIAGRRAYIAAYVKEKTIKPSTDMSQWHIRHLVGEIKRDALAYRKFVIACHQY